jgi:hypothetical protein
MALMKPVGVHRTTATHEELRMTKLSNSAGYWRIALSSLLSDIQQTIKDEIESPSARLELGASRLTAKLYMLDYTAKNDSDEMVWETFQATVEENTPNKFKQKPWPNKLTMFVRGGTKGRTGIQLEAFGEAQYALSYLLQFHKPIEEPTVDTVLDFILNFTGADPDSPKGFNALRLAWDKAEEDRVKLENQKIKKQQDAEDARQAKAGGFINADGEPDIDGWRNDQQAAYRTQQQTETHERLSREISETIPELIKDGSTVVDVPARDGGYYFWSSQGCQWHRLKDSIRDRMILRGGRSKS